MPQHDSIVARAACGNAQLIGALPPSAGETGLCIGYSVLGRPLTVQHYGTPDAPLRVLQMCGQHGDEPAVRQALRHFCRREAERFAAKETRMQFAVLETANPDGFAARTRHNAQGIDLNRDHVWLRAPETRAVHRFIARWRPHFVVDLHNYPARREHLVRQGLRLPWDLSIDFPTHPAARYAHGHPLLASLAESLERCAQKARFRFGRYGIHGADGSMRHGTPKPGDARNTLALKFDIPVLLIEARNPSRNDSREDRIMVRAAVEASCAAFLQWASRHAEVLTATGRENASSERVPVRYRRAGRQSVELPFVQLQSNEVCWLPCERYRPEVRGRRTRTAPAAYAVPLARRALIGFLEQHGFAYRLARPGERFVTEAAPDQGVPAPVSLPGHAIFPIHQVGGRFLMLLIEPDSRSSIMTCPEFAMPGDGAVVPVRRVLSNSSISNSEVTLND